MKKSLLLIALIPTFIEANITLSPSIKDPFISTVSLSCEDLELQYIQQLKAWQYCGFINEATGDKIKTAVIQTLDNKQWLQLSDTQSAISLLPWKVGYISPLLIEWQVDLPRNCNKRITMTMPIQGK